MRESGTAVLSVIVDAEGNPRNLYFEHPFATDMDRLALQIAEQDRFTPAQYQGNLVAVAQSLRIEITGCVWEKDGKYVLGLTSQPLQELGAPTDPPETAILKSGSGMPADPIPAKVDNPAKPLFNKAGAVPNLRGSGPPGLYEVTFLIDRQGMPEDIKLTKSPPLGTGETLIQAIRRFRFKPAMRGNEPVVSRSRIQVQTN